MNIVTANAMKNSKLSSYALFLTASGIGFLIWHIGSWIFGKVEPWDDIAGNGMLYLIFCSGFSGLLLGIFSKSGLLLAVGIFIGQITYLKINSDGPLLFFGVIYILFFSLLAWLLSWVSQNVRKSFQEHDR